MSNKFTVALIALAAVAVASISEAQSCIGTPAGVVSWWPGEGNAEDIVGNNEGTLEGDATFVQGQVGSAFTLDGLGDDIFVADDPSLELQEFTIEGWVRGGGGGNYFVAAKSGTTGNFGYELGVHVSGGPRFTINGGIGAPDVISTSSVLGGDWHHIAGTYSSPRAKIYVDGVLAGQDIDEADVIYEAASPFFIGVRQHTGIPGYLPGDIDELTFYSRALCITEIEAIFNAGSLGKCDEGVIVQCPIFLDDFELGDTSEWSYTAP